MTVDAYRQWHSQYGATALPGPPRTTYIIRKNPLRYSGGEDGGNGWAASRNPDPTGAPPLDPAWGLPSPDPLGFTPPRVKFLATPLHMASSYPTMPVLTSSSANAEKAAMHAPSLFGDISWRNFNADLFDQVQFYLQRIDSRFRATCWSTVGSRLHHLKLVVNS